MLSPQARAKQRLWETADSQSGYFTAAQAVEAGYSYETQVYQTKTGNWIREGWGIYRLARYPHVPGQELVRLMLWSRNRAGEPQAVVSHESALEVFELSKVLPGKVHLTVKPGFRKPALPEVQLHTGRLPVEDVWKRDGYSVTRPLRTLFDVARSGISPEHLGDAVVDAIESGLVGEMEFLEALVETPARVRRQFVLAGVLPA